MLDIVSSMSGLAQGVENIYRNGISTNDIVDNFTSHKSFARGALDSTLQFPCLISDAITIDMASTLARTLERVYASFVQVYLSMNNTIDISKDKNASDYLKRFHHNIKVESTAEDLYKEYCIESDEEYEALMERIYDGTTKAFINKDGSRMILFNFSEKFSPAVYESHKEQLVESLRDIDFTPFPNIGNSPYYEAPSTPAIPTDLPGLNGTDMHDLQMRGANNAIDSQYWVNREIEKQKFISANSSQLRTPTLTDADVKKSNEMQPYTMQVRLMGVNSQKEFVQFLDFVVGVKVNLHNIKSEEMIMNIQNTLQNKGALFSLIRWTTGEKSLFKDLILQIDDVKLDVANRSKGASGFWVTLKRLKETAKRQKAFFSRTQFVPNSTIVVSSYDVDAIQKNYGVSLKDVKFAKMLMDKLFLMNFVIVDDGTRTVEILYDGQNSFNTYALETLEREVSMNSNKIGKELTRMISR